jgi:glycosyltransferase involved in cell wall biosynthesis
LSFSSPRQLRARWRNGQLVMEILLLRAMAGQGIISSDRFADMLQPILARRNGLRVTSTTINRSRSAERLGLRRLDGYLARMVRYPLAVRGRRADIYHILGHSYAHLARTLPRDRTIISCQDLIPLRAEQGAAGFRAERRPTAQFRWITSHLKTVARVACISRLTRDDVHQLCGVPHERLTVIPLGVDARFRPLPEEHAKRARSRLDGRYVVLHVSSGAPYKNVPGTLRVIAALRQQGCDVSLVRAGQSLNPGELHLAKSLGIEGKIIDCGVVSDHRLVELYNAADLLLFPSFYEGFGLPVLEAMACGLPAVISDCPALLEVAGDAAAIAPASDVKALAQAVIAILQQPELAARLRRDGMKRAALFSWQSTADAYAQLYADVFRESMEEPRKERDQASA